MNLAQEIREYLNQEKIINKAIENLQNARELSFEFQDDKELKLKAQVLDNRYNMLESKLTAFTVIVLTAYKINLDYFFNCINQYSEVING